MVTESQGTPERRLSPENCYRGKNGRQANEWKIATDVAGLDDDGWIMDKKKRRKKSIYDRTFEPDRGQRTRKRKPVLYLRYCTIKINRYAL